MKTLIATLIVVLSVFSFSANAVPENPIGADQVPFKMWISKERQPNGTVYRYVALQSKRDGLVINSLKVTGEDCRESVGNAKKPFKTVNGGKYAWRFLIISPMSERSHGCWISHVTVDTNMGGFTFDPEPYYN